jgi:rubredoxin
VKLCIIPTKPKEKAVSSAMENNFSENPNQTTEYKTWMCLICGWLYDEAVGLPDEDIPAGTRWEDIPMNWTCPDCGARKEDFEMVVI